MATRTKRPKVEPTKRPVLTIRPERDLLRVARIAASSRGQTLQVWTVAAMRGHALHQATNDASVRAALDGQEG